MTFRRAASLLASVTLMWVAAGTSPAGAVPPTREEIATWCADAEDTAHCLRLIEAEQLKRLPGLATRKGGELTVTRFPSGATTFADVDDIHGGTSYTLWDNWSGLNAVVIAVTREDRTTYLLLMRANGQRAEFPAEPVLSPDRQRIVTADFCAQGCSNEVALWRVTRDAVTRLAAWAPRPTWSDAVVGWKDADTLALEYTPMGAADAKTEERPAGDPVFRAATPH